MVKPVPDPAIYVRYINPRWLLIITKEKVAKIHQHPHLIFILWLVSYPIIITTIIFLMFSEPHYNNEQYHHWMIVVATHCSIVITWTILITITYYNHSVDCWSNPQPLWLYPNYISLLIIVIVISYHYIPVQVVISHVSIKGSLEV